MTIRNLAPDLSKRKVYITVDRAADGSDETVMGLWVKGELVYAGPAIGSLEIDRRIREYQIGNQGS